MNTYLITPTLIQSWQYWYSYDGDNEEEVKSSFLTTLRREKTPTSEAMQKGINFENDIQAVCKKEYQFYDYSYKLEKNLEVIDKYEECISSIADILNTGMWQIALQKEIQIADTNFLLYGKADVIKEDTIFDIKYTTNANNYDLGKYSDSIQHLLYMFCAELNIFQYIISDGKSYWLEYYNLSNAQIYSALSEKISNFYSFLQNNQEFLKIFQEKWQTQ